MPADDPLCCAFVTNRPGGTQLSPSSGTRLGNLVSALIGVVALVIGGYALTVGRFANNHPGAETYDRVCVACHTTGAAGAPVLGDAAAWGPRIAQGRDALLATAIAGKGSMPPRGACSACSEDDLRAVIDYMISQVR